MISRFITQDDYGLLEESIKKDEYHKDTSPEFFYEDGTVCLVYSDEEGPVLFARGKVLEQGTVRAIELDIQYVSNTDARRNMKMMLEGFPDLEAKALQNGFSAFFFFSDVPLLRKFCTKRLGFEVWSDIALVKVLKEE